MERSTLITEKIDQLVALAELEEEPNTQIILLALSGARATGMDGMLATMVQEYVKNVLLPKAKTDKFTSQN